MTECLAFSSIVVYEYSLIVLFNRTIEYLLCILQNSYPSLRIKKDGLGLRLCTNMT